MIFVDKYSLDRYIWKGTMEFEVNTDLPSTGYDEARSPLEFPQPIIDRCTRITARVFNPRRQQVITVSNVLVPTKKFSHDIVAGSTENDDDSHMKGEDDDSFSSSSSSSSSSGSSSEDEIQVQSQSNEAYWLQRKLRGAIYGRVCYAVVLHKAENSEDYEWIVTQESCAVKELSWKKVKSGIRQLAENPLQEIAAMQYLQRFFHNKHWLETHLLIPKDILSDPTHLYLVLPYCDGGELFSFLESRSKFTESECRHWMKQLMIGVQHLQQAGVCHRDMSLENCLVHQESIGIVIDFGMCLKIPYQYSSNHQNNISDFRTQPRYWIRPSGVAGKLYYMSPEVLKNEEPFDGHAIDVWACGVMLFLMSTGFPPWEKASWAEERFRFFSQGYTVRMLTDWELGLSADLMDLLERMFFLCPRDRLSVNSILNHPWMNITEQPTSSTMDLDSDLVMLS